MTYIPSQEELINADGIKVPSPRLMAGDSLWAKEPQSTTTRRFDVGGAGSMYPSVAEAIGAALASPFPPSANNRAQIHVHPGKYVSTVTIDVPSWVTISGDDKFSVQFQNDATNLFRCVGDNVSFRNFLVEGSPTAGLFAIDCNDRSRVHVRDVDMLSNGGNARQLFMLQQGDTWRTLLFEHCILDGWHTSGVLCIFDNTAAGNARDIDLHINDCFIDSLHLTGFGGGVRFRKVLEANVRGSLIRGASAFHTGVRCENGGGTGTNVLIMNSYLTAGVPVFGEVNTNYVLTNTDALGSLTSGTRTLRNSSV